MYGHSKMVASIFHHNYILQGVYIIIICGWDQHEQPWLTVLVNLLFLFIIGPLKLNFKSFKILLTKLNTDETIFRKMSYIKSNYSLLFICVYTCSYVCVCLHFASATMSDQNF